MTQSVPTAPCADTPQPNVPFAVRPLKPSEMRAYALIREYGRLSFRDIQEELGVSYKHANMVCVGLHALSLIHI